MMIYKSLSMMMMQLKEYIDGRDVIDLVRDFGPWGSSAQEFVSVLRKIPTRLYSIASSIEANPEEVHLTIGVRSI